MGKFIRFAVLLIVLVALFAPNKDDPEPSSRQQSAQTAEATPVTTPVFEPTQNGRRHRRAARPLATSTATPTPRPSAFSDCDANIRARTATTTCPFASNVFYEYYAATGGYATATTVSAWSPAGQQYYDITCSARIVCVAGDGAEIRFAAAAVAAYDDDQAAAYVADHDVGPNDDGAEDPDLADETEDWEYEDPYEQETSAAPGEDIPGYDDGNGYRVQCADGMYSQSGGLQGACSGHGGLG